MVSATSGALAAAAPNILLSTTTSSVTGSSFANQLAAALEKYLGSATNGSPLEIDIQPASSQNSGAGQFLVTVKTPTSAAPATTPAARAPVRTLMEASKPPSPATTTPAPVQTPVAAPPPVPNAGPAPTNEVDAYWATQPPEVQALRAVPDDGDRMTMAKQLAAKGYAIDVPIMVWGWDPLTTMMIRQGYGYTWVPSGAQPNLPAGPGISFPGAPNYDSGNPPAGSIKVTTDFAKGLESTSPWYSSFSSPA